MSYTAGSLNIELLGVSESAISSITRTTSALRSLSKVVEQISQSNFASSGTKISQFFTKIANSTNSINVANVTALSNAVRSLGSISKIGNFANVDFSKISKNFTQLTTAISPFLEKLKKSKSELKSLSNILDKVGKKGAFNNLNSQVDNFNKKIRRVSGGSGKGDISKSGGLGNTFLRAGKGIKNMLNISKWYATYYLARRLGTAVSNITKAGSDYTETLNLWQVAMRDNLNTATNFVNKMNEAYGISEKTLMNAQATFKNMIGSLGQIPESVAYSISEAVTLMAVDYSSLYNVTMENAVQKFQSALAGQVRPIRTVSGYDITETTIYQLYQSIGGQKTMRQLNRTEKQLLSIYAVFEQMGRSGALGDMTKTIDNYANQSRMVKENWIEFTTWLGVSLQYLLQNSGTMQKINALLITASETARAFAYYLGYTDPNFAFSWADGVEETNEQIDELTGKLAGFDSFRSLSGGQESPLAIDQKLLSALSGYTSLIDKTTNKARTLANTWLEILGFQYNSASGMWDIVNEDTGIVKTFNLYKGLFEQLFSEEIKSNIKSLLQEVYPVLSTILVGVTKIVSALVPVFSYIIEFATKHLPKISPIFETIADILVEVAGVIFDITNTSDNFSNNTFSLLNAIQYILNAIKSVIVEIRPVIKTLLQVIEPFLNGVGGGISAFVEKLQPLIDAIKMIILKIVPIIANVIKIIMPLLETINTGVFNAIFGLIEGILHIINSIITPIENLLNNVLGLISTIVSIISPLIETISSALSSFGYIADFIAVVIEVIVSLVNDILTIIRKIVVILKPAISVIQQVIQLVLNTIQSIFTVVKNIIKLLPNFLSIFANNFDGIARVLEFIFNIIGQIIEFVVRAFGEIGRLISYTSVLLMPLLKIFKLIFDLVSVIIETILKFISFDFKGIGNAWVDFGAKQKENWTNWDAKTFVKDFGILGQDFSKQNSGYATQATKQAVYQAVSEQPVQQGTDKPVEIYFDGELMYEVVTEHANKRGEHWGQ